MIDPRVLKLQAKLGDAIPGGGGEVRFRSPFQDRFADPSRPDSGHHLYVNPERGKFCCFKSGVAGSLSYLFVLVGEKLGDATSRPAPLDVLRNRLQRIGAFDDTPIPRADLPEWYRPVRAGSPVYHYLLRRGLTDADIAMYRLGEGDEESGTDRHLVVPSFGPDGLCDFWVSRHIDRNSGMKYRNPKGVPRRHHVGFAALARSHSDTAVLCEGVFSAIVAGPDAVCTYGKFVSADQIDVLRRLGFTRVIVALDGDVAAPVIYGLAERIRTRGLDVGVVTMPTPGSDPADVGRAWMRALIEAARPLSPLGILRERLVRCG